MADQKPHSIADLKNALLREWLEQEGIAEDDSRAILLRLLLHKLEEEWNADNAHALRKTDCPKEFTAADLIALAFRAHEEGAQRTQLQADVESFAALL